MAFQEDKFGHKSYEYSPRWVHDEERHPDKRRSDSSLVIGMIKDDAVWAMEVRGLGAIVFRTDETGEDARISIYTDEELKFDK